MARRKQSGGCLSSLLFVFLVIYIISQINSIPDNYKTIIGDVIVLILAAIIIYLVINTIRKNVKKIRLNNYYKNKQNNYNVEYKQKEIIIKDIKQQKGNTVEFTYDEKPVKRMVMNYEFPNIEDYVDGNNVELIKKEDKLLSIVVDNNTKMEVLDFSSCNNLLLYGLIESGKSSITHSLIKNIILKKKYDDVQLGIIDTRKLEYNRYKNIPHLICPIINDSMKAMIALENLYREIQHRFEILAMLKVKNINEYNKIINKSDTKEDKLPYIVFIIDELNDLLINDKKGFTEIIKKIITDSRAVGVYIICNINTLNQSVIDNNFVGLFNSVISFKTSSVRDSKLLFDNAELNQLSDYEFRFKNKGIKSLSKYKLVNVISNDIIDYYNNVEYKYEKTVGPTKDFDDPLMNEIIDFAVESGKISASLIQRRFRLGYNRAARIIDELEARGIIGPQNGSKPREVLVKINEDE